MLKRGERLQYLKEGGGRTLAEYWRDTGQKLSFIRKSPDDGKPQYWRAPADMRLADTVWSGVPVSSSDHGFKTAKSEKLLAEVIKLASQEGDLVLDFFSGAGTTLATAHKLKRRWIGVEQMDYIHTITVERLKGTLAGEQSGISKSINWRGGGSFIYCELALANQIFLDRVQGAQTAEELTQIWAEMQARAFLSYRIDPKTIDLTSADFNALSLDDRKRFLIEIMDKNMLYVPLTEMDDESYAVNVEDKKLNRLFFNK